MARPAAAASSDSRARILAAAANEFAARGYAGANVDRIARTARLNKAMIYYHFTSKAALYREILNDMFGAVRGRVTEVAASDAAPADKIRRYIEAIAAAAEARPHFPPIWLRELAEGGEHIDEATLGYVRAVLVSLGEIVDEGLRRGCFRPVNHLILHGGIIAPLMFFFASAGLRRKLDRGSRLGTSAFSTREIVAHIQQLTLAQLEGRLA
jgi:AcrR family transcriptional regulator